MGGLLGFLVGKHLQDQHNTDLGAQKNILDMYSHISTTPYSDPAINQQAFEEYFPLTNKNPKYFRKPEVQQKAIENLQRWKQMEQQAKGAQATAPPPTQSLASQGPPGAAAPSGGNNYGQFASPPAPPNGLGQQIVQPVPVPPPDVPPPPPMGMDMAPAATPPPTTAMLPMVGPLRGDLFKKKAEADITTASKIAEQKALQEAEFERMKGISAFNRQENEALMKRMKQEGGGGHIYSEIGVNGAPSLKLDPGVLSSRPVAGKDLLDSNPDMTDKYGKPIDPLKFYDRRQYTRAGGEELMPTSVPPIVRVETPDPTHPETRMIVARDRNGTVIYQEPYAPNAAFAPLVRSSTTERMLNLGDRIISVPATTTNRSQRVLPGQPVVAPPPAAGGAAPNVTAAPTQPRTAAPTSTIPSGAGRSWQKNLSPTQVLPMKNSIEVASHQLWGDPDNPSLRPLASYANLADDQGARQRLGQALRLVLDAGGDSGAEHLGASAGPVSFSAGNLGTALSYNLGIPQAAADAKATALRDIFAKMKPEEVDYFNSLMNAIPTITGFRKLTSGGAFRWSQQGLERELPMIGLSGVTSSSTYAKKMAALGDEPLTAIKNLERFAPGAIDPRLTVLIKGGGRGVAPPGPPAAGAPAVGTIMKGYKFKGGNPADQSSWEKVP